MSIMTVPRPPRENVQKPDDCRGRIRWRNDSNIFMHVPQIEEDQGKINLLHANNEHDEDSEESRMKERNPKKEWNDIHNYTSNVQVVKDEDVPKCFTSRDTSETTTKSKKVIDDLKDNKRIKSLPEKARSTVEKETKDISHKTTFLNLPSFFSGFKRRPRIWDIRFGRTIVMMLLRIPAVASVPAVGWQINPSVINFYGAVEIKCIFFEYECITLNWWKSKSNRDVDWTQIITQTNLSLINYEYEASVEQNDWQTNYSLLIRNFQPEDFVAYFRCECFGLKILTDTKKPFDISKDIKVHPSSISHSEQKYGDTLEGNVRLQNVYPEPSCELTFEAKNVTVITNISSYPGPLLLVTVNYSTNVEHDQCHGLLNFTCFIGSERTELHWTVGNCTLENKTDENRIRIIFYIIPFVALVALAIVFLVILFRKDAVSRTSEKTNRENSEKTNNMVELSKSSKNQHIQIPLLVSEIA